jgi:hypothetical protein
LIAPDLCDADNGPWSRLAVPIVTVKKGVGPRLERSPQTLVEAPTEQGEPIMKAAKTVIALSLILSASAYASAQTVVVQPEQETVIREYIREKPVASITLPGVELNLGSTLDETVELYPLDVPDVQYRYVVVDGTTYLVEPTSRKIVYVVR